MAAFKVTTEVSKPVYGVESEASTPSLPGAYGGRLSDALCLGTRLCPRTDRFQEAIARVTGELKTKPYSSEPKWIQFHNLYTFYTVWMFSIATGVRKIITPYVDPRDVSTINGVALLRDKDSDSGAKAKLIWIPEVIMKQMEHYADHLKVMRDRFQIENVELPCFFLSDEIKVQLVRPKSMFPYVSRYLPGFPVDIHRRFIFNCLLDAGCPSEIVRVWMGHAVAGEEWWAPDATFSHAEYRSHLRRYLVPILEYLCLNPIKGMGYLLNRRETVHGWQQHPLGN